MASAQSWPKPFDYAGGNDQASTVVVDHRGNVIVAGTVTNANGDKDAFCISYDALGNENWRKDYNGPSNGDDYGTGAAVDWEGNVYMCGVSYGGSTRKGDFFVIKLRPSDGNILWPSSVTRSGYDFDNGALRLSDSSDDGFDANGSPVCAISIEDVAGSQPVIAITGPTKPSPFYHKWRTVVLESDATDGIRIRSGWPKDDFGVSTTDDSYGVAIDPADDNVYVAGSSSSSTVDIAFTTVRYNSGGSRVWTDQWFYGLTKDNVGKAIALDSDSVYVTGYVTGGSFGSEVQSYGTRRILKAADGSGNAQPQWSMTYDQSGSSHSNQALSVSLSREVSSGSLVTYAYVTGQSSTSSLDATTDIATIRYRGSDGNEEWVQRYGSSGVNEEGHQVVAVGNGDAYVAGFKTNSLTGYENIVAIAYKKTGSQRSGSPFTYAGGNGDDFGNAAAIGGAGLLYFAGASTGNSSLLDYLTGSHVETATASTVASSFTDSGSDVWVSLTALDSADGNYAVCTPGTSQFVGRFYGTVDASQLPCTELSFVLNAYATGSGASGLREEVEAYDYLNSTWVEVSDQPVTGTAANTIVTLKDAPARFVDGSGNVGLRITYYGGSSTSWAVYMDQLNWRAIYN